MKIKKVLITTLGVYLTLLSTATYAKSAIVKSEDGSYSVAKPIFTYGTSLTSTELAKTKRMFDLNGDKLSQTKSIKITGVDLVKWLPELGFSNNSGVWSSSFIRPANGKSGVHVQIKSPENITSYTEAQYRNAATTLGLTDAIILVGSAKQVDGSGAMAGIYTALGKDLSKSEQAELQKNSELAQDELTTIGKIATENKSKDDFSDDKFNQAVAKMKDDLQQESNHGDQQLSTDEIQKIVDLSLKKNGLTDLISPEQKQDLISFLQKFQKSPAINNEKLHEQLKALENSVSEKASEVMNKAKDVFNSDEAKGILEKIADAFKGLWKSITGFFSKED